MLTNEQKLNILKKQVWEAKNELIRVGQLRPLVKVDEEYSKCISFELMSEYAIKWMEQEGLFDDQ